MRIARWLAALLIVTFLLTGCGETDEDPQAREPASTASQPFKSQPHARDSTKSSPPADVFQDLPRPDCPSHSEHLAVTLDGEGGPENVGVIVAFDRGFFADLGLDVSVAGPRYPRRAVPYVATGIDDIGLAQQPQVVLARDEGVPIVAFGSVISEPTATMIWLEDSGIHDIADLAGKTIAVPGVPFQEEFLGAVLARAGLTLDDIEIEPVNYKPILALQEGRADALFGGAWNIEGAALEADGVEAVIKRVQGLGLPHYEEVVAIARAECVRKHPDVFRDFMTAIGRGASLARRNPKEAERVIEMYREFDPEFTRKRLRAQLDATLPLLTTNPKMDLTGAARLSDWMREEGMIRVPIAAGS